MSEDARPLLLRVPRTAICTVCDDRFLPGLETLLHSLRAEVPAFDRMPVRVFQSGDRTRLHDDRRARLHARHPNVAFVECAWRPAYDGALEAETHRSAYLALESFRQTDMERVIYMDCDMLCTGDLGELLFLDCDFAAVPCRKPSAGRFNSGLMVIGRRLLCHGVADEMIAKERDGAGYWADQPLINAYLERHSTLRVTALPEIYNFMYIAGHTDLDGDDAFAELRPFIRLIHWAGREQKRPKPWDLAAPLSEADQLWQAAHRAATAGLGGRA